jgi:hypothetical protein
MPAKSLNYYQKEKFIDFLPSLIHMSLYRNQLFILSYFRAISHLFPLFARSLSPPPPPPESQLVSLLQRLVGALGLAFVGPWTLKLVKYKTNLIKMHITVAVQPWFSSPWPTFCSKIPLNTNRFPESHSCFQSRTPIITIMSFCTLYEW